MGKKVVKKLRLPDPNETAFAVVRSITGEPQAQSQDKSIGLMNGKNPAAVALGKLGGAKGGAARAAKLSAKTRSAIAKKAAAARWAKKT